METEKNMKYSIEEQVKIAAELQEISPVDVGEAVPCQEADELDLDDLSLVTAARGQVPSYQLFLQKAKGEIQ